MISRNQQVDALVVEASHAIPTFLDDLIRCAHPQPNMALRVFVETFVDACFLAACTPDHLPTIHIPSTPHCDPGNPY